MKQNKIYLTIVGKPPRARKVSRFELIIENEAEALPKTIEFIKHRKLREAKSSYAYWSFDESKFINGDGVEQTIVFKILPLTSLVKVYPCATN